MVKPVFRRKSIGTKVSEEEYAQLEALAGGRAMSEWAREVLLRELEGKQARPADETVLAEVLALRTILRKRRWKAVLAGAVDYAARLGSAGRSTARFQGSNSSILLTGWSAMRVSTSPRYVSGSTPLSFAVPITL